MTSLTELDKLLLDIIRSAKAGASMAVVLGKAAAHGLDNDHVFGFAKRAGFCMTLDVGEDKSGREYVARHPKRASREGTEERVGRGSTPLLALIDYAKKETDLRELFE